MQNIPKMEIERVDNQNIKAPFFSPKNTRKAHDEFFYWF
jgi:hypothetical protein